MRLAVKIENQHLYSARYDEGTGISELVTFSDGCDHLHMYFRVDEGLPRIVNCEDEANIRLQARDEMMPLEIAGLTGYRDPSVSAEDLLVLLFERLAERVGDVSDVETVVLVGVANPVFQSAAVRAGFEADFEYIELCEASIRAWQWIAPEAADAKDVCVLGRGENGNLTWDYRVAALDGAFIIPADAGIANSGRFFPSSGGCGSSYRFGKILHMVSAPRCESSSDSQWTRRNNA